MASPIIKSILNGVEIGLTTAESAELAGAVLSAGVDVTLLPEMAVAAKLTEIYHGISQLSNILLRNRIRNEIEDVVPELRPRGHEQIPEAHRNFNLPPPPVSGSVKPLIDESDAKRARETKERYEVRIRAIQDIFQNNINNDRGFLGFFLTSMLKKKGNLAGFKTDSKLKGAINKASKTKENGEFIRQMIYTSLIKMLAESNIPIEFISGLSVDQKGAKTLADRIIKANISPDIQSILTDTIWLLRSLIPYPWKHDDMISRGKIPYNPTDTPTQDDAGDEATINELKDMFDREKLAKQHAEDEKKIKADKKRDDEMMKEAKQAIDDVTSRDRYDELGDIKMVNITGTKGETISTVDIFGVLREFGYFVGTLDEIENRIGVVTGTWADSLYEDGLIYKIKKYIESFTGEKLNDDQIREVIDRRKNKNPKSFEWINVSIHSGAPAITVDVVKLLQGLDILPHTIPELKESINTIRIYFKKSMSYGGLVRAIVAVSQVLGHGVPIATVHSALDVLIKEIIPYYEPSHEEEKQGYYEEKKGDLEDEADETQPLIAESVALSDQVISGIRVPVEYIFSPYIQRGAPSLEEREARRQRVRNALIGVTTISGLAGVVRLIMDLTPSQSLGRVRDALPIDPGPPTHAPTGPPAHAPAGPIDPGPPVRPTGPPAHAPAGPVTGPVTGPTGGGHLMPYGPVGTVAHFPTPLEGGDIPYTGEHKDISHAMDLYNAQSLGFINQDLPEIVKPPNDTVMQLTEDEANWHSFNFVQEGYGEGGITNNPLYKSKYNIDRQRYQRTFAPRVPDHIPVNVRDIRDTDALFYPVIQNNQPFKDAFDDRPFQSGFMIDPLPLRVHGQRSTIQATKNLFYPNLSQFEYRRARK